MQLIKDELYLCVCLQCREKQESVKLHSSRSLLTHNPFNSTSNSLSF